MSRSSFVTVDIHDPVAMRRAGPDQLSLALMDARNRLLQWLTAFERLPPGTTSADCDPPAWVLGQAARFQEFWIARNVQCARGEACDRDGVRLASIDPVLDWWLDPDAAGRAQRWVGSVPAAEAMRAYLGATLETTLELLEKAEPSDTGLYFYRLALWHEDRLDEALAVLAQSLGVTLDAAELRGAELPARPRRDALWFPGQRMVLGSPPGGFVPDSEQWAHEVAVPEFEIDAQPVCWAQFAEFVDDGGYDEAQWWSEPGWHWVQAGARRAPRHVEQMANGVLLHRFGRLHKVPGGQTALHLSWYEADAWCRWAGRRLPTEAEWALAAQQAAGRGFAWGDGLEWMAGRAVRFAGHREGPARLDVPVAAGARVLRGASFATVPRQRHPGARRFLSPEHDAAFTAFRSCAV